MKSIMSLGFALLTAAALFALPGVASASGGIVADQYPVTLSATPIGDQRLYFEPEGIACNGQKFEAGLEHPSTNVVPTSMADDSCTVGPLAMNGCKLEFNLGSNSIGVGPAGCGPSTITTLTNCKISINSQTGRPATYTYKNVGSGSSAAVQVHVNASPKVTQSGNCKAGENVMEYVAEWEVTARNGKAQAVGIKSIASGSLPVGVFMAGDLPENEFGLSRLDAQVFPVNVNGALQPGTEFTVLKVPNLTVRCTGGTFSGGKLSVASTEPSLNAEYSGCKDNNSNSVTVKMNGCHYSFSKLDEDGFGSPLYEVETSKITCASGSERVEVLDPGLNCTVKILPQVLDTSITEFENQGQGSSATIDAVIDESWKTLHYEKSGGFLCGLVGNGTDGSLGGKFKLSGTY